MHNKAKVIPRGEVSLLITRKGDTYRVKFIVVPGNVTPLLSLKACQDMHLVEIKDCDKVREEERKEEVSSPSTTEKPAANAVAPSLSDPVLQPFLDVFSGIGAIPGEYTIRIDNDAVPQVIPPRRIPFALQDAVKSKLDRMQAIGVVAPVTEPTDWVNSMVVVRKQANKVRICIDRPHLNAFIKRSHYPLPTFDDIAARLHNAKVFSVLDAKTGFWHVRLEEKSSLLTTFNTPYGRYRWLRMPFGIASAPEEWQRRKHKIIKGLSGVEVIADDFLIIGSGNTQSEAIKNHDSNLTAFLQRAREKGLTLNPDKMKLRLTEVRFVGHKLTSQGVAPDPQKVEAILQIPRPTDVHSLRRILGMINYLAKFLPKLSEVSAILRGLERKGTEWKWSKEHDEAWNEIKALATSAPVLAYFNPTKTVTLQ